MRNWRDYQVRIPEGESGLWAVRHFEVPSELEEVFRDIRRREEAKGWGALDELANDPEPERHIVAGSYTKLEVLHDEFFANCVMSDTQPEIEEHYPLFDAAHGRVLIHGLGLGMCALACARNPRVRHVHVIEKSRNVLNLVAPHTNHQKLSIEQGDVLKARPSGIWDCVWSDIWTFISADNLPEMRKLEKVYRGKCGWHGFWLRDACERRARKLNAARKVAALQERFKVRSTSVKPLYRLAYQLEQRRTP